MQGVSIDMEDDYDPMSLAEQERQERQMALEAEAEERVSFLSKALIATPDSSID